MMKNVLFFVSLFVSTFALAQENGVYHGFRIGAMDDATINNVSVGDEVLTGVGTHVGYICNVQMLRWAGLEFGIHSATRSSKVSGTFYEPKGNQLIDYHLKFDELSVNAPALFKLRVGKGPTKIALFAGASFNYVMEVRQSKRYFNEDYNDVYSYEDRMIKQLNTLEIEYVGGAGLEFPIYAHGIIAFNYRYHLAIYSCGELENGDKPKFSGSVVSMSLMYKPQKKK